MREDPVTYFIDVYDGGFVTSSKSRCESAKEEISKSAAGKSEKVRKIGARRGFVTGFSRSSARHLREFLLSHRMPENEHFTKVAITYTVNSLFEKNNWLFKILVYSSYMIENNLSWCLICFDETFRNDFRSAEFWRLLLKRWRQRLLRFGLVCVWRIELQRSGEPHLHCIGFIKDVEDVSKYWQAWVFACDVFGFDGVRMSSYPGFLLHGFLCTVIKDSRWFAYVCAHAAKHKKSQLGWSGRQWGVINREKMEEVSADRLEMTEYVAKCVARCIRRRYHFKSYTKDMLGSRLFLGMPEIKRLVKYFEKSDVPF